MAWDLVTIDPGEHTGITAGTFHTPVECGVFHHVREVLGPRAIRAVIEIPNRVCVSSKDVISLAMKAGAWRDYYARAGAAVYMVPPNIWMGGSVPKRINQPRIREAAHPAMIAHLDRTLPVTKRHNAIDSLGIFLWAQKNLARLEDYRYS